MVFGAVLLAVGCKGKTPTGAKGSASSGTVLAKVDDVVITDADLKEVLARHASQPFVLARYSSIEKKKELLDSLIRYHVFAAEARRRGFERDPEVRRVAEEQMVRLFTQQEIHDRVRLADVSPAEVERHYREHPEDFLRPELVRVSQIVIGDRAKATKVLAAARAMPKADLKAFRELVTRESEDEDSRQRGGDLTQFDRATALYPKAVVTAAFALRDIGDVSDLVSTERGFVILKLTERRPATKRSLDEVRPEIQKRLLEELRAQRRQQLADEMRKTVAVEVFEGELAKLELAGTPGASAPPTAGLDAGSVVGDRP